MMKFSRAISRVKWLSGEFAHRSIARENFIIFYVVNVPL
jgi:hypothetical protein